MSGGEVGGEGSQELRGSILPAVGGGSGTRIHREAAGAAGIDSARLSTYGGHCGQQIQCPSRCACGAEVAAEMEESK